MGFWDLFKPKEKTDEKLLKLQNIVYDTDYNKISGYLQTNDYSGYNKVEYVKRLYCLVHIRRKFFDIITELNGEALKQSLAIIGFNYCEKLYSIEKDIREQYSGSDNYYDDRHRI